MEPYSGVVFLAVLFLPVIPLIELNSCLLGVFTTTLPLLALFFARALDGATGGNIFVANTYLADLTSEEDRNRNYGRMSVASNLGYVVGLSLQSPRNNRSRQTSSIRSPAYFSCRNAYRAFSSPGLFLSVSLIRIEKKRLKETTAEQISRSLSVIPEIS